MKMKLMDIFSFFLLSILLLSGCQRNDMLPSQEEEWVISFNLPQEEAINGILPHSRAIQGSAGTELLSDGTLFSVRAYKKNKTGTPVFVGKGVYKVETGGTTAVPRSDPEALKLTRGTYDLYFLSYNSSGTVPDATGETVSVSNGNDFLGATLEQIIIQADKDGQTSLTIPMDGHPFRHLCSRVKATLEVPKDQPVAPKGITDLEISVKNLRTDNTYTWLSQSFTALGARDKGSTFSLIKSGSLSNIQGSSTFPVTFSSPSDVFLLPLDESAPLLFDVSMKVSYTDRNGQPATATLESKEVELKKALLPAMSYNFVFTLTFYGDYLPADLTLDVLDYIPVDLTPDDVGGDE